MWLWPAVLAAQSAIPVFIGRPITLLPPAVDAGGQKVAFGAAITPDGVTLTTTDVYLAGSDSSGLRRLTRLPGDPQPPQGASAMTISADGSRVALTALVGPSVEEVHVVDVASSTDRTVAADKEGCIQPLCANCFFHCVNTPHLTADGTKVLYSVRRPQPFFVVNADGTGLARLPVFSGTLAPGPQRVISKGGQIVFTSSAPAGPTFAAAATDVYLCNLDGTNIRPVTKFGNDPSVFAFNATISADGNTIAFEKENQVWVVRSDGAGLRSLASGGAPSISGDGGLVAFVQGGQIYLVRADGSGLRALTGFKMSAALDPVIADDGSRVVFSIGPRDGQRGALYAADADGKNLRPVYAPRALNQGGVSGLIDFSPPSPGSLFTAYGQNLTLDMLSVATRFPLPETLGGVSLLVNGRPAPLVAVTPWQVNAQLPPEISEGPTAFQFRFADGAMPAAGAADVRAMAPAISFSLLPSGGCQGAALRGRTGVVADKDNPAQAGETLEIYGTGLGPAEPFVPAGVAAPSSPPARVFPPEVLIGGRPAEVTFAGLAPGFAGVYQVNATLPSGLRPGAQNLIWRAGTVSSSGCATIYTR